MATGEQRDPLEGVLIGGREQRPIVVVDPDPAWPERYERLRERIVAALGPAALRVEHIGSTSVPGLAAKPIIDVLVAVQDVDDEAAYLPLLEQAGFVLRVREPGHRMVRTPERDVHVHLYAPASPAVDAYLDLRDWLRVDAADRALYERTKRALAQRSWADMNAYADAKTEVVLAVLGRARAWRAGAHRSDVELLALHAVRLRGMATAAAAAERFGLDRAVVGELLEDFAAAGWVRSDEFAGTGGWSLTESGRARDELLLRAELELTGARPLVQAVHADFLPLNARFQQVVTRWQLRPLPGDALAANDHTDVRWDDRVLGELVALGSRLADLGSRLSSALHRFDGYGRRFSAAAQAARRGERGMVDGLGVDSCHRVWFELHEDLLATLGLARGDEGASG